MDGSPARGVLYAQGYDGGWGQMREDAFKLSWFLPAQSPPPLSQIRVL